MNTIINRFVNNNVWMFVLFTLTGSICCILSKNENFFDLANYHYYNAFAFLNNRLNYDIVPASINTFFNPLLDLPLYAIIRYFNYNLTIAYALQGLWFGMVLFAFFKIVTLFFDSRTTKGLLYALLACAIAATGPLTWFQAGSCTNEIPAALFVMTALYFLLKMVKYPQYQSCGMFLLSGLVLGAVLGLKPTVVTSCLAAGACLIICRRYLSRPVAFVALFTLGGLLGFLLTNGWWMYKLYTLYGNPFFPFFNGFFHSPYFDDFNYSDRRFIPPLKLAPLCPYLSIFSHYCNGEGFLESYRLPLYYTLSLAAILYFVLKPQKFKNFYLQQHAWFMLSVFMLISYLLWLAIFSIQHYIIVLEMLGALLLVKFISLYQPQTNHKIILYYTLTTILCGILLMTPSISLSFGHRHKHSKMIDVQALTLPPDTLVKLYNLPLAGIIPHLAKNNSVRALGYLQLFDRLHMKGSDFAERGKFRRMRDEIEQTHQGPIIVLFRLPSHLHQQPYILQGLRPALEGKSCRPLKNSFAPIFMQPIYICVPDELQESVFGITPDL